MIADGVYDSNRLTRTVVKTENRIITSKDKFIARVNPITEMVASVAARIMTIWVSTISIGSHTL